MDPVCVDDSAAGSDRWSPGLIAKVLAADPVTDRADRVLTR